MMTDQASIQKTGIQVVTTSMRCVEPHATMNIANPTTKKIQSRAMTLRVRRAMKSSVQQMLK